MIRSVINKIVDDKDDELYKYLTDYGWYFDRNLCGGDDDELEWKLLCQDHKLEVDKIKTNFGIYFGDTAWCVYRFGLSYTTRRTLRKALRKYFHCDKKGVRCERCPCNDTCKVPELVNVLIPLKTVYCGEKREYWGKDCQYGSTNLCYIDGTDIEVSEDETITVEQPVCDD